VAEIAEAQAAFARHNKIMVRRGYVPTSVYTASSLFFVIPKDHDRLEEGLRLAGVPEYLLTGEFAAKNHLKADDIRRLLFGRRLGGRDWSVGGGPDWKLGAVYDAIVSKDGGRVTLTGPWGNVTDADTSFDGDKLCYTASTGAQICCEIFFNPGGTRALMNEMIWLVRGQTFTFSLIE